MWNHRGSRIDKATLRKKNKTWRHTHSRLYYKAAAAKSLQSCPTLCDPINGNPPGSPSLGFSRQEHWSGLPFPSPMRESEFAQSCLTCSDPMDCSLPGSSVSGIFQARVLEWGAIASSERLRYLSLVTQPVSAGLGFIPISPPSRAFPGGASG